MRVQGLGFRNSSSGVHIGFRDEGSGNTGIRVYGSGFRDSRLEFRDWDLGTRVQHLKSTHCLISRPCGK